MSPPYRINKAADKPQQTSDQSIYILRIVLVIMTMVYVAVGLAGGVVAMLSALIFDDPASTHRPALWLVWLNSILFPLSCFFAIKWAWSDYGGHRIQHAYRSLCLPLVSLIGLGLSISILIAYLVHAW